MSDVLIALLPYILPMVITLGTALAFRQSYAKSIGEIQTKVIATYKEQNELLLQQLARSNRIMAAMRYALKELGLHITVNGSFVSVYNARTQRKKVIQIQQFSLDAKGEEDIVDEESDEL
jgi:predicted amino acid dehydrogenase